MKFRKTYKTFDDTHTVGVAEHFPVVGVFEDDDIVNTIRRALKRLEYPSELWIYYGTNVPRRELINKLTEVDCRLKSSVDEFGEPRLRLDSHGNIYKRIKDEKQIPTSFVGTVRIVGGGVYHNSSIRSVQYDPIY